MTPSVYHRRTPRGFSLVELLVIMTMVGILMAIMVPRFRISERTESQLAGMQLAQDIDLARTRALSTRSMVRVVFDDAADNYGGFRDNDDDGTINESALETQSLQGWGTRPLPDRMLFGRGAASAVPGDQGSGAITFADGRLEFDSRGLTRPFGASGTVYLVSEHDPTSVVAVQVAPSGNVRFWTWKKEGGWK